MCDSHIDIDKYISSLVSKTCAEATWWCGGGEVRPPFFLISNQIYTYVSASKGPKSENVTVSWLVAEYYDRLGWNSRKAKYASYRLSRYRYRDVKDGGWNGRVYMAVPE